jgi:hypothetical protein
VTRGRPCGWMTVSLTVDVTDAPGPSPLGPSKRAVKLPQD